MRKAMVAGEMIGVGVEVVVSTNVEADRIFHNSQLDHLAADGGWDVAATAVLLVSDMPLDLFVDLRGARHPVAGMPGFVHRALLF